MQDAKAKQGPEAAMKCRTKKMELMHAQTSLSVPASLN